MFERKITLKTITLILILIIFTVGGLLTYYYYIDKTLTITNGVLVWSFPGHRRPQSLATVDITDEGFSPTTVSIYRNSQVTWVNKTSVPQHIASDPHPSHDALEGFDSGTLMPDESFTYTFEKKGSFTYHSEENSTEVKGVVNIK